VIEMKTIKNRIGNAVMMAFMGSIGWGVVGGIINKDIIFGLSFFCAMFFPLLLATIILFICNQELDFFDGKSCNDR